MMKIDIFSGFLGAGKTTLIKKLIKEAYIGEKLVLIENEFGEIGIDGGFLKESGINITEMNSGCICCSLVGDFGDALKKVIEQYSPDRIIIEPSGVGKLSDVIKAVKNLKIDGVVLNSSTTVVDANKCKMYMKNFGEFFCNQVEHANCIVFSRTSDISDEKLEVVLHSIKEKNAHATVITTDWNSLEGKTILEAMEHKNSLEADIKELHHKHHHHHDEECRCHEHEDHHHHHYDGECHCHEHEHEHHHHHADEVFTSFGKETASRYTFDALSQILKSLDSNEFGTILRAKGIVEGENKKWLHFDYVPGEAEIREGAADVIGRICVIGAEIDAEKLEELFNL